MKEMVNKQEQKEKEKGRKGLWIRIAGAALLLILLILCLVQCQSSPQLPDFGIPETPDTLIDGRLTSDTLEALEPDYFNIKINSTPTLADGKMNLRVENSERNGYACRVEVALVFDWEENGNTTEESVPVYRSPLIQPGQSLEDCTIKAPVEPGKYQAVAQYTLYPQDQGEDGEPVGKNNIALQLTVK